MERRTSPQRVVLRRKALEDYRRIVTDDEIAEIRDLAHDLRGLRILELSSTATGGGVAELLASLVPLERDLGLDAHWHLIAGDTEFFETTKRLHNGMQGMDVELTSAEREEYLRHNRAAAAALHGHWDVVLVHDPQPAAVRASGGAHGAKWIWRCHVDSSSAQAAVWTFLRPFVEAHDRVVFTLPDFVPSDLATPVTIIPPAIDPLSSKNRVLPMYLARATASELGVDLTRPLLLQVSRFDPWKDPLGVVEVWRTVGHDHPSLQLALVGAMANDDPEAWRIYRELEQEVRDDQDCLLLTNQTGVNAHEVNALQRIADVAIQKSIREGFGLVVAETLWKGTPMVAGRAGGIPTQLVDGETGILAESVDEFASGVGDLLVDPDRARRLGMQGHRRVGERFLLPRLLADQLRLFHQVLDGPH